MSSSVGVLDFFIVEANEYIERLDGLLASAAPRGPDTSALARNARMLRGSATMSRQQGIAAVAGALERVARALGGDELRWDPEVSAAVTAAVDDLRILLRNVRAWSAADDQRSAARAAELARFAPATAANTTPAASRERGSAFLAGEASDLSRALERFAASPTADTLANVLHRLRTLRGVAVVRDMAPLGEVMEATENTLKALELGGRSATDSERSLATAAAALLRRASHDLRSSGRPEAESAELDSFRAALDSLPQHAGKGDRIVPITQLFHDDAGPHVVRAASHPPTTAAERFRLEVVSLAEHLRVVVAEARAAGTGAQRERIAPELRNALRALGSAAHSFGERTVARFAAEWSTRASALAESDLVVLDRAAALLADPATRSAEVERSLAVLGATSAGTADRPTPSGAPASPAPSPSPDLAPRRTPLRTPTGRELHDFLQDGLAAFRELDERPLSAPAVIPDDEVVPIEQLLYSGRGALERAAALRAELLDQHAAPSREAVEELFDLIELALVE